MTTLFSPRFSFLLSAVSLVFAGCTATAVDPGAVASVKSVTLISLEIPEYAYFDDSAEGLAKSGGVALATAGFGAVAGVFASVAVNRLEQKHRDAIRDALAPHRPSFSESFNKELDASLTQRGIATKWVAPPPRVADNSTYDVAMADFDTDYAIELFPAFVGFAFGDENGHPTVNIRWRLLKRYPGGKYIETNRGSVTYSGKAPSSATLAAFGHLPPVAEYQFAGQPNKLISYGDAPALAMRDIARQAARMTADRALPATTTK